MKHPRNEIPAPQNSCISILALFLLSAREASFVSTGTPDQATSLEFRAFSLIDPFLDEFSIPSSNDFPGIAEVEEHVLDGLFG